MRLKDKVAVVTGGAQGIGEATASALAAEGARVVLADVKAEVGRQSAARICAAGGDAEFALLNVADQKAWGVLLDGVAEKYGRIDCLVNNAGIDIAATIEDARIEDFQRILEINLFSQFYGMQTVIPIMKRGGGGSIINVASLATHKLAPTSVLYGPTKAAAASLTKAAAIQCAQYDIRINSIHPGPTATAILLGEAGNRAESPDIKRAIAMIPMGRMGEPLEIGSVAVFLASDNSRYMTGAELFVDGGLSIF